MTRYTLTEMHRQTAALATDLPGLLEAAAAGADQAVAAGPVPGQVVALGSGDSLNAALAVRGAFAPIDDLGYWPMTATEFLDHPPSSCRPAGRVTVIGVSASGGNPALVTAMTAARAAGSPTVAVTARAGSPLSEAAARTVLVATEGLSGPSPGIRTYQGSLLGLLALARAFAREPAGSPESVAAWLSGQIEHSARLATTSVGPIAAELAAGPMVVIVGSGPALGTARHVAAKITETAALPAIGVEPEDWWHVHRFGHPRTTPVIMLVPPGQGRATALTMARRTAERQPVFVVAAEDDTEAARAGSAVVPVAAGVPEIARPLVDSVFAGPLAVALAQTRNALPFANP